MGRSFDRGGKSRKERERGKRRAYQQAERDREARGELIRAKRQMERSIMAQSNSSHAVSAAASAPNATISLQRNPAISTERPQGGFLSRIFSRIFKKSA